MKTNERRNSRESTNLYISIPPKDDPIIPPAVKPFLLQSEASLSHNLSTEETKHATENENPFRRWMTKLHKHSLQRRKAVYPRQERWKLNEFEDDPPSPSSSKLFPRAPLRHRKSSSWTSGSTALLAATRSAFASHSVLSEARQSMQDGSMFLLPRSRRGTRASASIDVDTEALHERARKRRQTIDEILRTESEYILSLKTFDHLYSSVYLTATDLLKSDMEQMQTIIGKLTDLHHELAHNLQTIHGLDKDAAEPDEAASVALVFGRFISRFFLYEQYASKYQKMLHNVGIASRNIPNWENYQRGLETLSNSITPASRENLGRKKSLTFGDLHMKPIQRLCKYPLLFADLCKYTPVIDGPGAHLEVKKVLFRLRDTVMEINQATTDTVTRDKIQRSWRLQDMLTLIDPPSKNHIAPKGKLLRASASSLLRKLSRSNKLQENKPV